MFGNRKREHNPPFRNKETEMYNPDIAPIKEKDT
jgi:hypothetical protein